MRGALVDAGDMVVEMGIIPADAGSTLRDPCNPNNIIDEITDFYSVCIFALSLFLPLRHCSLDS